MKAEEAKKIADQALQNLTDALKSGKSERITQYLTMLAKFHRYSLLRERETFLEQRSESRKFARLFGHARHCWHTIALKNQKRP